MEPKQAPLPRKRAIVVIGRVLTQKQKLEDVLEEANDGLSPTQRGWLHEVSSGTLRWKGRLEYLLKRLATKKAPTGWLRRAILLGLYQLVSDQKVSDSSVVVETVDLVKKKEGQGPAGFANALLRRYLREKATSHPHSADWASLPDWIWKRLVRDHDEKWAMEFAEASLARPRLWLRWKETPSEVEQMEEGPLPGAWKLTPQHRLRIPELKGFRQGEFYVQDISSQLLLTRFSQKVREAGTEGKVLDLCASPGGKAVGLAWLGWQVLATDYQERRLPRLKENVERCAREQVTVLPYSEASGLKDLDWVWVDAPCTATGLLRRHPEIRWVRGEDELSTLTKIQKELVTQAWGQVRPGGFLAYSVCSVLSEEGPAIAGALQKHLVDQVSLLPQKPPFGDGFWGALFRKPT